MMMTDAYSSCHPAVAFTFFAGTICCSVVIQHPAYLIAGCLAAAAYDLLLKGRKALKNLFLLLPFALLLAAVNPLFNTAGERILFYVSGRPYTLEALLYGAALAGIFLSMMLWFSCFNVVMSSDKIACLFGNLIPSLSLLLTMVFRMVPGLTGKTQQVICARRSIGKGSCKADGYRAKLDDGMTVLSAMTSWALEGSIVTADSMRSRGYGTAKRSSFMIYRMSNRDRILLTVQIVLLLLVILSAAQGQTAAAFTPELSAAPVSWGIAAYSAYLMIPVLLHLKEALQWHISRSKI